MLNRLLPNPTVTLNRHSFASLSSSSSVSTVAKAGQNRSLCNLFRIASLDSSSYGSVQALTISPRISTITVLKPGPEVPRFKQITAQGRRPK